MNEPITVVIVDDHALMREGLREILEVHNDIVVVGQAGDAPGAIAAVGRLRPRVVLLDVEIPGGDVTDTIDRIHSISPRSAVVILSMYDGPLLLQRLIGQGIRGYLLKSASSQELVAAVRSSAVDDGRVVLLVSARSLAHAPGSNAGTLSPREIDVLELAAQAYSNSQIASRLYLTEATIKRHLSNIFAKLGAVSRIDAVNKAIAAALISGNRSNGDERA